MNCEICEGPAVEGSRCKGCWNSWHALVRREGNEVYTRHAAKWAANRSRKAERARIIRLIESIAVAFTDGDGVIPLRQSDAAEIADVIQKRGSR